MPLQLRSIFLALLGIALAAAPLCGFAQERAEPQPQSAAAKKALDPEAAAEKAPDQVKTDKRFLRIRLNDQGDPLALETSILSYAPADGAAAPQIDLIGAVHIGERSYYDQLNQVFKDYDALLYELVAPEEANVPGEERRGGHPISAMQLGMKNMLGLEFQLECVDYKPANFVHADMSPAEFAQSMKDRGESFTQLFFRMMGQSLASQANGGGVSDVEFLFAFFSKDRKLQMKRLLAQQFQDLDNAMYAIEGPDGTTLIRHRNEKAFEVLAREIAAGKKRIGVFYGAGHLPDMERRLLEDFGMKPAGERWLTAWSLDENASPPKKNAP